MKPHAMELTCLVVNTGKLLFVRTRDVHLVDKLVTEIMSRLSPNERYLRFTSDPKLYVAKTSDGTWYESSQERGEQMENGVIPDEAKDILCANREMHKHNRLSLNDFPEDAPIHLLVKLTLPEWIEQPELKYFLDMEKLYFVNQEQAIRELQLAHRRAFEHDSLTPTFDLPIADQSIGMGKSYLMVHYIRQCREQ